MHVAQRAPDGDRRAQSLRLGCSSDPQSLAGTRRASASLPRLAAAFSKILDFGYKREKSTMRGAAGSSWIVWLPLAAGVVTAGSRPAALARAEGIAGSVRGRVV